MSMSTRLAATFAGIGLALTGTALATSSVVAGGDAAGTTNSVSAKGPDTPITTGWPGGTRIPRTPPATT